MTEALIFAGGLLALACTWAAVAGLLSRRADRSRQTATIQAAEQAVGEVVSVASSAITEQHDEAVEEVRAAVGNAAAAAQLAALKRGKR